MLYFDWYNHYWISDWGTCCNVAQRCFRFTLRSPVWTETIYSLCTTRLGLCMSFSSWLVLLGSIQILWGRPVWHVWVSLTLTVLRGTARIVGAAIAFEFIIMKFPIYIKDSLLTEMCQLRVLTTNTKEVRLLCRT